MKRFVLALAALLGVAAMGLAACTPAAPKIDKDDPFKTLYPWKHDAKGVVKLPSGVEYVIISKGDGKAASPVPTDRVEVHYDGRLAATGKQFDASYGGDPATFKLNQVIPGWTEGLQKMHPGDQFMFWIPSALGYGEKGARDAIPPNSDLMFRVELRKVMQALTANAEAWKKVTPWPANSTEVVRTGTGLEYLVLETGKTGKPSPGDHDYGVVQFEGRLDDGMVAASTFEDERPQVFPVDQLVPGWAETLKLMHPGDHWMVRMPAALLYQGEGDGKFLANQPVTFEIIMEDMVAGPPVDPNAKPAEPAKPAKPADKAKPKAAGKKQ